MAQKPARCFISLLQTPLLLPNKDKVAKDLCGGAFGSADRERDWAGLGAAAIHHSAHQLAIGPNLVLDCD